MSGFKPFDPASSGATSKSNTVSVSTPEDFQNIISDKGYSIGANVIDMTGSGISIEVPAGGLSLDGFDFEVSKIICTDPNYTLFTSPVGGSGTLVCGDVTFEISGANSKVMDLTAATPGSEVDFGKCQFLNCTSLGEINGFAQGLEADTRRIGGTPTLTLSGNWLGGYFIRTSLVRQLDPAMTEPIFKAGTGLLFNARFKTNHRAILAAAGAFLDFTPANFANASDLQLQDCSISRGSTFDPTDTTIIPNITAGDLKSAWRANTGIDNTNEGGALTVTAQAGTAASTTWSLISGTWTASDLQHFNDSILTSLQHDGNSPRQYRVSLNFTVEGTASTAIKIRLVKVDDSTATATVISEQERLINNFPGARDLAFFDLDTNVDLDVNDYVYPQIATVTGTDTLTVENGSEMIVSAR